MSSGSAGERSVSPLDGSGGPHHLTADQVMPSLPKPLKGLASGLPGRKNKRKAPEAPQTPKTPNSAPAFAQNAAPEFSAKQTNRVKSAPDGYDDISVIQR